MQIFEQLIVEQRQPVADADVILGKTHALLRVGGIAGDCELGAADLLTTEQVTHGFNGRVLVIEVWFKMQFHISRPRSLHVASPIFECKSDLPMVLKKPRLLELHMLTVCQMGSGSSNVPSA